MAFISPGRLVRDIQLGIKNLLLHKLRSFLTMLGLVFGGVYLKTGKLRYSLSLHMIINFMGSVLAPGFLVLLTHALPVKPFYEITAYELLTNPMIVMLLCYLMILVILFLLGTLAPKLTILCGKLFIKSIPLDLNRLDIRRIHLNQLILRNFRSKPYFF